MKLAPQVLRYSIDGGFLLTVNGLDLEDVRKAFDEEMEKVVAEGKTFTLTPIAEVQYDGRTGSATIIGEKAKFWQRRARGRYSLTTGSDGSSVAPS